MAKIKKKKTRKKKSKKIPKTPQQIAQAKQKNSTRALFKRIGFERIKIDKHEFTFKNRTGEFDDAYILDNVVVICEYTIGADTTAHVAKKKILYDLVADNQADWVEFFKSDNANFAAGLVKAAYHSNEIQVRIAYISITGVSEEIASNCKNVFFLDGTKLRYFEALSKTIHRSARFELFKYFKLPFSKIGAEIKSSSGEAKFFSGHILPENFSSFPPEFKVVSFYADPATLLQMAYVLRRDSWLDVEGLYQRILLRGKIRSMRHYLTTDKRVFVNNIIVTLPKDTKLNDPDDPHKNLNPKNLNTIERVTVAVPFRSDTIGLIDGQHRIFCYHEGSDKYEVGIAKIRNRQNLLVTGIIFPDSYTEEAQRTFEAKLFLEINDTQSRTKSDLKHGIELVLRPNSTIAIAKAVIHRLSEKGPLAGMLQTNYFDPPELIKTSSIVSYGLKPLVRLDSPNSAFHLWKHSDKSKLPSTPTKALRADYVAHCAELIGDLLSGARAAFGSEKWKIDSSNKTPLLTPTTINGFIVCLRLLIEHGKVMSREKYQAKLSSLNSFKFSQFKSSQWRAMGEKLYAQFF